MTQVSKEVEAKQEKPNCYDCKHRRNLPGDAHSRCAHPSIGETDNFTEAMAIFASIGRGAPVINVKAARELNITAHPHGIRRGWFNWPYNFDPTWLLMCDGFESKDKE